MGLFAYSRLCSGVASSPGIFQLNTEQSDQDISMTAVYLEYNLVTGRTLQQALDNLMLVLGRSEMASLRLSLEKYQLMEPSCINLGHKLDATGIRRTPDKLSAI